MLKQILDRLLTIFGIYHYYLSSKYSQHWSDKKIYNYQYKKLKKQLNNAKKTEYYSSLFKEIDFDVERDFKCIEDIEKIPITNKQDVTKNVSAFTNHKYTSYSLTFRTSGSTRNPMEGPIHFHQWIIEQSVIFRHWKWGGYNFRDKTAMIRAYCPEEGNKLWKYKWSLNTLYFSPFHLTFENMHLYFEKMQKEKVKILRGYPSSIKTFTSFMSRQNLKLDSLKLILVASEVFSDRDRRFIEHTHGCKVSNHYGLAESIIMMGDCENHTHLHNYFEYGYVELMSTEKNNVMKIIGTNLNNKTMPLIRYDTGDLAIVDNTRCNCNRNGIVVKNIIGRNDQQIKAPNGALISTVNFYTVFYYFLEIDQWQIVIYGKIIEFAYISKEPLSTTRYNSLAKELNLRLQHTNFQIRIQKVGKLEKMGEGKIPTLIVKSD